MSEKIKIKGFKRNLTTDRGTKNVFVISTAL